MTDYSKFPKSLAKLCSSLSDVQLKYIASVREQILTFDENLIEQGFSTRTLYGLKKSKATVLKQKACAEFIPILSGVHRPRLRLQLPYPKRKFGAPGRTYHNTTVKGFAWVEARHQNEWDRPSSLSLLFYLSKGQRPSYTASLEDYTKTYQKLSGHHFPILNLKDLIQLALEEWKTSLKSE